MSGADDVRARSGDALTLTWPQGDIALVTMVREREMNTLSLELIDELGGALTASVAGGARALIVTGQGRAFCAGAHLRAARVPAGGVEGEARHRLAVADHVGDDRDNRRGHFREIEAGVAQIGFQRDRGFANIDDAHHGSTFTVVIAGLDPAIQPKRKTFYKG